MKKRLVLLFGPVLLAALIVIGVLLVPFPQGDASRKQVQIAATSLSPDVFRGARLKDQALAAGYVPFLGSSELSRMDPFHPSVLAAKYDRDYQPLLLGNAGTQSLAHFVADQSWIKTQRNKKVVMILSLQWFTKRGQDPRAFANYYSPLQTILWLRQADPKRTADRYAAHRLLGMEVVEANPPIRQGLLEIAAGQPLDQGVRHQLGVNLRLLENADALFSRFQLKNNVPLIEKGESKLPASGSYAALEEAAGKLGEASTTNNAFGIDNHFFATRLKGRKVKALKNSQARWDYRFSPEYSDLELLLDQFAKNHIQVQFIIPPINQKWARYTGLSQSMITQTAAKVTKQLKSQGFTRILDLSQDGDRLYFMQDTIHLGWRGWVAVDETVKPFLTDLQPATNYHIDTHYFTKEWQNAAE